MELHAQGTVGEATPLPLEDGGATGYSWQLDLPEGVEQAPAPRHGNPRIERLPGEPLGLPTVFVRASAAGTYVITARLARPWEGDEPISTVEVLLTVS